METMWVGIDPRPDRARILAIASTGETILKARLLPSPSSRLAMPALLEALALWQGHKVRAALVVGAPESCGSSLSRLAFEDFGNVLYTLDYVPAHRPPRRRDGLGGMGDFRDLRQLMLFDWSR